jgi:glyoxylase-like metal-dependent hydrolase (beta-lactamase superfamily II)
VEEGADTAFTPDIQVRDRDVVCGSNWSLECVHTPCHTSNHVCYRLREEKALLCGDHVMAWSTSIISPPDGNLSDYMSSLEALLERDDRVYWPTHGPAIDDPKPFVRSYLNHRRHRIDQVLACLADGVVRIEDMLPSMYPDLPAHMHGAAARSVLSTLIYLVQRNAAAADRIGLDGTYGLI